MATIEQIADLIQKHSARATKETIVHVKEIIVIENDKIYQQLNKLDTTVKSLSTRLLQSEQDITNIQEKTNSNMDDILLTRNDMADLADNIESLQNNLKQITVENQILSLKLDEQIDRNMRETLVIHGVPGAENSWENTKNKLSAFISELSNHKLKCDKIYMGPMV